MFTIKKIKNKWRIVKTSTGKVAKRPLGTLYDNGGYSDIIQADQHACRLNRQNKPASAHKK